MYTLKVLIVVVAVAAGVARPSGEEREVGPTLPNPPPPTRTSPELRRLMVAERVLPDGIAAGDVFFLPPDTNAPSKADFQKLADFHGNDINDAIKPTVLIPSWLMAQNFFEQELESTVARSFAKAESEHVKPPKATPTKTKNKKAKKNSRLVATDGGSLSFALKPSDDGYYAVDCKDGDISKDNVTDLLILEETPMEDLVERSNRQDQELKSKNLVTEEVGPLRAGLSTEEAQGTTHTDYHHFSRKNNNNSNMEPIYGLPLLIAVCVVFTLAIVGFVFSWSALSKKAKAAAEVEYPAYGVTGPSVDSSGDRKLAHSAHIYHYQHQKQQIMAMEKGGMDTRNGSISDPESEEENDDGDYTVYECPGFATTGEMEVKNPMFKDEPTPGKSSVERPKPKE